MRIALAITPYFTNGDTPPLGMSYINAALVRAGHDVRAFDLIHDALVNHEAYFAHFRKIVNLGLVADRVPFFLNTEFTLYALYHRQYPKELPKPDHRGLTPAWAAGAMMLEDLSRKWADMMLAGDPELILLSTYTSNVFSTMRLAAELKKKTTAPIVLGGPGVGLSEVYEWALATGFGDGVVVGEGEITVVETVNKISGRKLPNDVPGLALPGKSPRPRPFMADLDDLPAPLYDGLPSSSLSLKDYEAHAENPYKSPFFVGLPVMASRGCANRCAYCSEAAFWKRWRRRDPLKLAREISSLMEKTGRDVFLFCDSALNLDPVWLDKFLDAAIPLKARFLSYMVAHEKVDDRIAAKMYKAGWRGAVVGVETLTDRMRRLMRKRMTAEEAMNTLRAFAKADIWVKANILCGFPTETEDDVDQTIAAMEKMNEESDVKRRLWWDAGHPLRLEPYSGMYHNPAKYGIKLTPYKIELPGALANQQPLIDRLTVKWDSGLSPETVMNRSRRIISAANNPTE